jgi:hypothetical protein
MINYAQFHDGLLEGLLIISKTVHLHLCTDSGEHLVAVAHGVAAFAAAGFRSGNIVLEIRERSGEDVTFNDIVELYDLREGPPGVQQGNELLAKARKKGLRVLEISPSYGAGCKLLMESMDLIPRAEWLARFAADLAR